MIGVLLLLIFSFACVTKAEYAHSAAEGDAGLTIKLNDKVLDYAMRIGSDVVADIMGNLSLPDQEGAGYSISGLTIEKLNATQKPKVSIKFAANEGFDCEIELPYLNLKGQYSIGFGFLSTSGDLEATINDFNFKLVLNIYAGLQGLVEFDFLHCNASVKNVSVQFKGSWASDIIQSVSPMIESYLGSSINTLLCGALELSANTSKYNQSAANDFYKYDPKAAAPEMPLCPSESIIMSPTTHSEQETFKKLKQKQAKIAAATTATNAAAAEPSKISMNFSLIFNPKITDHSASLAFNGSMLYKGESVFNKIKYLRVKPIEASPDRMARVVINEVLPNTFLYQAYAHQLVLFNRNKSIDRLPGIVRNPIKLMCRECLAKLETGLSAAPKAVFTADKLIKLSLYAWVDTALFETDTGREFEIFLLNTQIRAGLSPYIKKDRLMAHPQINGVTVKVQRNGLGKYFGVLAESLTDTVTQFILDDFSVEVEGRLDEFVGAKGGIAIPEWCGIKFTNPKLLFRDGAILIDTDIDYDTKYLVSWLRSMIALAPAT